MSEIANARINSFGISPKADIVSRSEEPVFILTATQLQAFITQAIQPLQDEVMQLRATVDRQDEKIAALESTRIEKPDWDTVQWRLDKQSDMLAKLASPDNTKDSPLLDELYKEMKAIGRKQTDFATAARMVKRSKRRIMQLKGAIALDQRFILITSESHSQKLLIRLREFYQTV